MKTVYILMRTENGYDPMQSEILGCFGSRELANKWFKKHLLERFSIFDKLEGDECVDKYAWEKIQIFRGYMCAEIEGWQNINITPQFYMDFANKYRRVISELFPNNWSRPEEKQVKVDVHVCGVAQHDLFWWEYDLVETFVQEEL